MSNDFFSWAIPLGVSILSGAVTFYSTQQVISEKLKRLEDDMRDLKSQGQNLRDKVIASEAILKERGPVVRSSSPVSLTERGQAILAESGGNQYLEKHLDKFVAELKKRKPKSAYDVQEFSKEIVEGQSNTEDFIPLKNYLFQEGIGLEDLVLVLGTELRDRALPELGFDSSDLDQETERVEAEEATA